ncbi:MAG: M1 family metallopeptidase [Acidimicrobiales bacterium]
MTAHETYRLPRDVEPIRYELILSPDLGQASFSGSERIEVNVVAEVSRIVLNAAELDITSARLVPGVAGTEGAGAEAVGATVSYDEAEEQAIVHLGSPAAPGRWYLELEFSGILNDKLRGFYRSTFTDDAGREHVIATTQFEPTDARRAFPCWDEPDRKAVFSITVDMDADLEAISNYGPESETELGDGRRRIRFADTMVMSTYLVALIVGPLRASRTVDAGGVPLRIVHVPGKEHLVDFALDIGAHALAFFTEWFGIAYPADKLDLIALPDFAAGAMENLGAVTFREQVLLIDPDAASRRELERVADVVAHEIAHMWFGDLVTMKWWNGLWLNEAFATFMEMLCVDDFRPAWERWVSFGLSRGTAMGIDGLSSTRAIEYQVGRPSEVEGMFDALTYEKGAAVLRMLERYLGAEAFRDGIRAYIAAHAYANAETTDLWDAIEAATGQPARATMDTWIFQGGHPLVTVSVGPAPKAASPDAPGSGPAQVVLEQTPFRYGAERPNSAIGSSWQVPVLLKAQVAGRAEEHRLLLGDTPTPIELSGPADWVVVNAGGHGFYRVAYQGELLGALTSHLGDLGPLERFNLVADSWATTMAGRTGLGGFLDIVGHLGQETDANVWSVVIGALKFLDRICAGSDRDALSRLARDVLGPQLDRLGWEPSATEAETVPTLRSALVEALGTVGADPAVRRRAAELHADLVADGKALDPDLAGAIVSVVASNGGGEEYESFLARYRKPTTPQEETRYLYALAGFTDQALVARTLDLSIGEVRSQNAGFLIQALLANPEGGPAAWAFVKENFDLLMERLPHNAVPRMLEGISALCRPGLNLTADIKTFLAGHPIPSGRKSLDQTLERLDINVAFAERVAPKLGAVLATA